ncbi:MAG: hypothetical protein HY658_07250 [Actinobacteria bacterium]|nr:hypothetical protein [Actinomycetota bacterium]
MGFVRYSNDELREVLAGQVRDRWPGECLILLVPCSARPGPLPGPAPDPEEDRGLLGVTEARMVFLRRSRVGAYVRVSAAVGAMLSVVALLGGDLVPSLVLASVAGALWVAGLTVEGAAGGPAVIPLHEVEGVDPARQEITGGGRGAGHRLRIHDPVHFGQVVRHLDQPPATSMGA